MTDELCPPKPSTGYGRHTFFNFSFVEHSIGSQVSGQRRKQLLFPVDKIAGVERCQFEAMSVRDRVRRASLYAVTAEDTAVVVDVIDLGVALGAADSLLSRILGGFDIYAIRGTGRRAEKTRHALFQPILVALQNMNSAETLLELSPLEWSRPVRVVLNNGRGEHLPEGDTHSLGNRSDVFEDRHARSV